MCTLDEFPDGTAYMQAFGAADYSAEFPANFSAFRRTYVSADFCAFVFAHCCAVDSSVDNALVNANDSADLYPNFRANVYTNL